VYTTLFRWATNFERQTRATKPIKTIYDVLNEIDSAYAALLRKLAVCR